MVPLFSKSRLIRAARDGHIEDPNNSRIMKQVWDFFSIYIDVQRIRDYHGDEIAIYFEWMNFLQSWLMLPALFSIIVFVGNQFFFDLSTSPLAGLFSIFMSLWGTIYLVSWRKHCRGLDVLWDDYIVEHDAEDLRKEF